MNKYHPDLLDKWTYIINKLETVLNRSDLGRINFFISEWEVFRTSNSSIPLIENFKKAIKDLRRFYES